MNSTTNEAQTFSINLDADRCEECARLRKEVERLTLLAIAVGTCNQSEVPERVSQAYREPTNYYNHQLVYLRDLVQTMQSTISNQQRTIKYLDKEVYEFRRSREVTPATVRHQDC